MEGGCGGWSCQWEGLWGSQGRGSSVDVGGDEVKGNMTNVKAQGTKDLEGLEDGEGI